MSPGAPSTGDIVHVRTRHYVVEGESDGPHGTVFDLACMDDDAQGSSLSAIWEFELDGKVVTRQAWESIGSKGFEPRESFAAFWPFRKNLAIAAWNVAKATSTAPWDFQSPARFFARWLLVGGQRLENQSRTLWKVLSIVLAQIRERRSSSESQKKGESASAVPSDTRDAASSESEEDQKEDPKTASTDPPPKTLSAPTGAREPDFVVGANANIRVGSWIEDSNYGIGRVLKLHTRSKGVDSHRVWFAESGSTLASHPLGRGITRVLAERLVSPEIRDACPPPPWKS